MIASLRGEVLSLAPDHAVIECAGVGYQVFASTRTLSHLRRGEQTLVLTSMVVRDTGVKLYGFADDDARQMFTLLQTVSGLGPAIAISADSAYGPGELAAIIGRGDAKALQKIGGVGKRMAERIVVDLKDKVAQFGGGGEPAAAAQPSTSGTATQVVAALKGLGFQEKQATEAADQVLALNPSLDVSGALRAALAVVGKK